MKENERPNVLVIMADQHRFDCIGSYGNEDVKTPNIDALANNGVQFNNSFCPYPICTPSRYSMLTGLYVHQHLGYGNSSTVPEGLATYPKVLRDAGYNTKVVGKMHTTPVYYDVGFDEELLAEQGHGQFLDDYNRYLRANNLCDESEVMKMMAGAPLSYFKTLGCQESNLPEEHHVTTWVADKSVETIENWDNESNNLLLTSFVNPHNPFTPPAPWSEMYNPDDLTLLDGWTSECLERDMQCHDSMNYHTYNEVSESQIRKLMAMYYGSISQIDNQIGRMIDTLKKKGLYDNTIIIYTSDHGEFMGFHHLHAKHNYMYDVLTKTPFIIKWQNQKSAGTISDELINNVDIAPTLIDACDLEIPRTMSGFSIKENDKVRDFVYSEQHLKDQRMIRTKTRKLIMCKDDSNSLYFDLEKDPTEMINLYKDEKYSAEIAELKEKFYKWRIYDVNSVGHQDLTANIAKAGNSIREDNPEVAKSKEYFANKRDAYYATIPEDDRVTADMLPCGKSLFEK